jgi:hypothetical protein
VNRFRRWAVLGWGGVGWFGSAFWEGLLPGRPFPFDSLNCVKEVLDPGRFKDRCQRISGRPSEDWSEPGFTRATGRRAGKGLGELGGHQPPLRFWRSVGKAQSRGALFPKFNRVVDASPSSASRVGNAWCAATRFM